MHASLSDILYTRAYTYIHACTRIYTFLTRSYKQVCISVTYTSLFRIFSHSFSLHAFVSPCLSPFFAPLNLTYTSHTREYIHIHASSLSLSFSRSPFLQSLSFSLSFSLFLFSINQRLYHTSYYFSLLSMSFFSSSSACASKVETSCGPTTANVYLRHRSRSTKIE